MEQAENSTRTTKIANFFSTLAHPILLVPVYSIYVTLTQLTGAAVSICIGITLFASVLLIVYMVRQVQKNKVSNFDASDKSERQNRVFLPMPPALPRNTGQAARTVPGPPVRH